MSCIQLFVIICSTLQRKNIIVFLLNLLCKFGLQDLILVMSKNINSDYFDVDWGDSIKIPEGKYEAVYVSHEITNGSFGWKVKIIFRIVSGEYFGSLLPGWYNIKEGGTTKRKGGRIGLSRLQKLTSELLEVVQTNKRPNRMSPLMLKGHLILIKVRTVVINSRQKKHNKLQQYSVVDSMIGNLNVADLSEEQSLISKLIPNPVPEPIPTINTQEACKD